ncbi:MAG: universal stress protein [Myxococcota bacterium]|nr:universal stress protein [Myxococcota bacterium]
MFERVLVPVDFSDPSRAALRLGRDLVASSGGTLTLLHVSALPWHASQELGMTPAGAELYQDLAKDVSREQMRALTEMANAELPGPMDRALLLREGFPPDEIAAQAKQGKHDVVVMGTHGRTGVSRAIMGSVAERVVRLCEIPVLITR